METAAHIIQRLQLEPLPDEGGYFRRYWVSAETLPSGRPCGTAIWFLVTPTAFSALHLVDADECWHFHAGDPVEHVEIQADGSARVRQLGAKEEPPSLVAHAGCWQGARLRPASIRQGWALVSCTMSPGWASEGFILGRSADLKARFPSASLWIEALTRS